MLSIEGACPKSLDALGVDSSDGALVKTEGLVAVTCCVVPSVISTSCGMWVDEERCVVAAALAAASA